MYQYGSDPVRDQVLVGQLTSTHRFVCWFFGVELESGWDSNIYYHTGFHEAALIVEYRCDLNFAMCTASFRCRCFSPQHSSEMVNILSSEGPWSTQVGGESHGHIEPSSCLGFRLRDGASRCMYHQENQLIIYVGPTSCVLLIIHSKGERVVDATYS